MLPHLLLLLLNSFTMDLMPNRSSFKRIINTLLAFNLIFNPLFAHEGMWIPALLNMDKMQAAGLKLTAEDIYSINHSSLKDAIVHFGGGCTGEIISDQGLLLTNYHCGYSQVQSHSSLENDYLKNGFWAMEKSEEKHNPGLTATFIVQMVDVTNQVLDSIDSNAPEEVRQGIVEANSLELIHSYTKDTHYKAEVVAFDYGNAYFLILKEVFTDVRLVGAPPSAIGKFGGDTDNWVWPRHTGDFSLFRIYTDKNGKPAEYAEENVPLKPKHHLHIDLEGVKEGDFTMVYGFPGRTYEYLHHKAVEYTVKVSNPMKIKMRKKSLAIIDQAMDTDQSIRIKYAAKQSRISNAYKKWIGQNLGLEAFKAIEKKKATENEFQSRIDENADWKAQYGDLLDRLKLNVEQGIDATLARDYFIEFYYYGPELLRFANGFNDLYRLCNEDKANPDTVAIEQQKLIKRGARFFKNFEANIDKQIYNALWPDYLSGAPKNYAVDFSSLKTKFAENVKIADWVYSESVFSDQQRLNKFLEASPKKAKKIMDKDPAFQIAKAIIENYWQVVRPDFVAYQNENNLLMRTYTRVQKQTFADEIFWPDANSTLRVTYGKAEGSAPRDGMKYTYSTTLDGIIQKNNTGNNDYLIPDRLRDLWAAKDYGSYATNGTLPVCFLGSNHTTGGNSGSPAINASGHLIGLNFDRTWESTMSDIMFDPSICRNIMVDMRYVLFIIDKYAGARHLVDEMTLVTQSNE